ncbi:acyl-CoA dehydrogenase family protein [Neobacillus drentensis]|uniref:acyl-CoA dehydrogenase family protein n=1 Tax=Neobacillus drentensis TaxID=220684 RepID=UPI000824051E|nr:acyl-CoA dehydrogenase [Neobacillus drentensis]
MSYELNEHQIAQRQQTKKYISEHLVNSVDRMETEGVITADDINAVKESGIWEMVLGNETEWISKVTVLIELAKTSPSFASLFTDLIFTKSILANKYDGQFYSAAFVEEEAGSDLSVIQTEARKIKNNWVLTGEKWFVANAELADHYMVLAKTPDNTFSIFRVSNEAEGIITQEQKKMGLEGLKLSKVMFNQVSIPSSSLILSVDRSFEGLNYANGLAKLSISSLAIGIAEAALEESLVRARAREQFGNPIGDFQAIQFKIADITVGINAANTLLYLAAQKLDRNEEFETEAAMAKVFSTEIASKAVNHAVQIHGSHGLLNDSTVSQLYRSQRLTEIFGQTSEMQRITIAKYVIDHIGVNEKEVNYGLSL